MTMKKIAAVALIGFTSLLATALPSQARERDRHRHHRHERIVVVPPPPVAPYPYWSSPDYYYSPHYGYAPRHWWQARMESIQCPCLASPSSASTKLQIPNSKIPQKPQATNPKDTLLGGLGFGILPARDLSELGFGVLGFGIFRPFSSSLALPPDTTLRRPAAPAVCCPRRRCSAPVQCLT